MATSTVKCAQCDCEFAKENGHITRAQKLGAKIYCTRKCSSLGRRKNLTVEQKKAIKRDYDVTYREIHRERRKRQHYEWFKLHYDPAAAAIERKAKMPRHVEYCRRPEYREYKKRYDRQYKARRDFGDFAEAALLLYEIKETLIEILPRDERAQLQYLDGRVNKWQNRQRALQAKS